MAPNYLRRTGYRLPTEAEWEYTCRAGAGTGYSFGEADDLLGKYGWYVRNTPGLMSVGALRPNEYGVFDMHGNVEEWTQSAFVSKTEGGRIRDDKEDNTDINNTDPRVLRGGSFHNLAVYVRSAGRDWSVPTSRNYLVVGFRPARTFR